MMNKKTKSNTERFGRGLARMWRCYIRRERRVASWLVAKGLPAKGAIASLWIVKLAVFIVLLYTSLWLVLLLAVAVVAAWLARNAVTDEENRVEWREGHSGFGLYDKNEWRHDMGDPEEP